MLYINPTLTIAGSIQNYSYNFSTDHWKSKLAAMTLDMDYEANKGGITTKAVVSLEKLVRSGFTSITL